MHLGLISDKFFSFVSSSTAAGFFQTVEPKVCILAPGHCSYIFLIHFSCIDFFCFEVYIVCLFYGLSHIR